MSIGRFSARLACSASIVLSVACGKSGPPLPPLVRIPSAPANVSAERRGASVDIRFTVPTVNTDNSHPANIERVDVYAITGPANVSDEQLLKRGTKIGSVDVKAPRDPDDISDEDEPAADVDPPEGAGLEQGAQAEVSETLTAEAQKAVDLSKTTKRRKAVPDDDARPLLGPPETVPARVYALVGVTPDGKRGAWSRRLPVPLVPPPPPPDGLTMHYDETAITVAWSSAIPRSSGSDGVLPSRPLLRPAATIAYNVYDVSGVPPGGAGVKLTPDPIETPTFTDNRMAWGQRRCYTVRTVESMSGMTLESAAAMPKCEALIDTFPPAAPVNLKTVASEGVINLIWDANTEPDLAGYVVFRGTGDQLSAITPGPIQEPHFEDKVPAGVRYVYAVKAIDRAGNASAFSNRQEEVAR